MYWYYIVKSNIDPIVLGRKLYSKEFISENIYKTVKDKVTREITSDHLDKILVLAIYTTRKV